MKETTVKTAGQQAVPMTPFPMVTPSEVNDDPAQILDVLTLSEQEKHHSGTEIDVARFVYEPAAFSIASAVLAELVLEPALSTKERATHEHN